MASLSALKNKAKKASAKKTPAKKAAPAKKAVAKKAPVKKAVAKKAAVKKVPAKKVPAKKIELKKDLTINDVKLIISAKEAVARQKEVLEELASRGVVSLNRIPKTLDKPLIDEAKELAITVTTLTEKLHKHGLGTPARILKKVEYALVAPPVVVEKVAPVKAEKVSIAKINGEDVELEEVELEDLDALVAEVSADEPVEDKGNAPRVVNLAEESNGNEEDAFTLKASEEDDAPAQTVMTAGATADPVKDYLKQIGRVALLNAELEVELATRIEAGLFAEHKIATEKKLEKKLKRELEWIVEDGKRA